MKRNLLFLGATAVAMLVGTQASFAQTGGAFGGTPKTINHLTTIEFENFDLGNNADATVGGSAPFGYSDKSTGNSTVAAGDVAISTLRSTTDVDVAQLVSDDTFKYVRDVQGGEYLYFSVTVGTTGKYHIDVNYAHGATANKKIKIERRDTDLTNPVVLVDGTTNLTDALPKTASSSVFETHSAGPVGSPFKFDLEAGKSYVIKFTFNDAGPNFNWFQFVRDGDATTLGVNDFEANNKVNVYPNPSSTGVFNIGESAKWEAYSVLGAKVASGEGSVVDLSAAKKGTYLIKTANGTSKVLFQ